MDKITKEYFTEWAAENNWLLFNQGKNVEGFPQDVFLTPSGQVVYISYDLDGNVRNVSMPVLSPPMNAPPPRNMGALWPPYGHH